MSAHDNEYHDNMVAMLELIWGEGYMAPGGPGNVARLLRGLETLDKRILDVGCGYGRHAHAVAVRCDARVVGLDLSEDYLEITMMSGTSYLNTSRMRILIDGNSIDNIDNFGFYSGLRTVGGFLFDILN